MIIREASSPADMATIRELFEEYVAWLAVDLAYQGFQQELDGLPGRYAPPRGRLLLAMENEIPVGCVAMRPLDENVCEMKRLFVRKSHQRRGLGRTLAARVISDAREADYTSMVLDTVAQMLPAIRLYESLGFRRRDAYYDTPLADTVFFERTL